MDLWQGRERIRASNRDVSVDPRKPFGEFCRLSMLDWKHSLGTTPMSAGMIEEAYDRIHAAWTEARKPKRKPRVVATGDAEAIYQAYPRKVGRQDALKAINKALTKLNAAALLERVQRYTAIVARWPEKDWPFCPHPATWFNRGRYDDDPAAWLRPNMKPEAKSEPQGPREPMGWIPFMQDNHCGWVEFNDPRPLTWARLSNLSKATVVDAMRKGP